MRKNTNNKKNSLRQNKCYKKHFFSVTSSNTHQTFSFYLQFFYELKHKVCLFSKSLRAIFHFYSILFLLRFIFTLREHQKIVNLFLNWDSFDASLISLYKAWSYKKKKHKKIKASSEFLWKESTVNNRCLLILDLKPFRS